MRRLLCALVLVAGIAPVSATVPDGACAGEYDLVLDAALGAPGGPAVTTSFTMTRTSGTCAVGPVLPSQFNGTLTGNCLTATGTGMLPGGVGFDVVWSGTTLAMTGDIASGTFVQSGVWTCPATTSHWVGTIGWVPENTVACYGVGTAVLDVSFTYVDTRTANFGVNLAAFSLCTDLSSSFVAVGTVTGGCELATGSGVTQDGLQFDVLWVDNKWHLSNYVLGEIELVPDHAGGENCVTGADRFTTSGHVVKLR